MKNIEEKTKPSLNPQQLVEAILKISCISLTISLFTQPLQAFLNLKQRPELSSPKANFFHWAYRGFMTYTITGQKRGAVAITAKQSHQEHEYQLGFTLAFSQLDILISNAYKTKAKLENAGIIHAQNFRWSPYNFYKLTSNNWGSRSISGLINYSALGFIGDDCASAFQLKNKLANQFLGGMSAGVLASIFSAFPDFYADQKTLSSRMHEFKLETVSASSMFKKIHYHVEHQKLKSLIKNFLIQHYLPEIAIRLPLTALTFAIIFSGDYLFNQHSNQNKP